jgi:NAD(P)H-hydrate repair Nnr-like enzyme with NAD(P)H-hydrate epimerase domain
VLSLKVAATVNCCDVPSGTAGFAGVMASETITAELTVSVLDPVTDPELAVMVAVP